MGKSKYEALDEFGKGLMEHVRDQTLALYERLTAGNMTDQKSRELYEKVCKLNSEDAALVRELIVDATDMAISYCLHYLDESEFQLFAREDITRDCDIVATSDGLAGELYNEEGWIARYSRYPE